MKPLVLVAASGLAREALEAIRAQALYDAIGVLDDDAAKHGTLVGGVKVLGGLELIGDYRDASVVICAGKGLAREAIANRLDLDDERYARVIHPGASIGASCDVGEGTIVLAGCVLTADVQVGRHVVAMPNVAITHDVLVEDFATLCAGATLGGSVHVGSGSYIGMSSSVRENLVIGAGSVVGMGSVVLCDISDHETWYGAPARRARRG
jgi:sugar O-acyltransferase (sialic acid O-acetyltransferase NeuD family)